MKAKISHFSAPEYQSKTDRSSDL